MIMLSDNSSRYVTVKYNSEMVFPYMDTFSFGSKYSSRGLVMVMTNDPCDQEFEFFSTDGGYSWINGDYTCDECGCRMDEDEGIRVGDYTYCDSCAESYRWCECCEQYFYRDDACYIESEDVYVCDRCLSRYYTQCERCDEYFDSQNAITTEDGEVCEHCADRYYSICNECGDLVRETRSFNEMWYCEGCYEDLVGTCDECDNDTLRRELVEIDGSNLCTDCLASKYHVCNECQRLIPKDEECEHCERKVA
jgi:formylmethanofuran dehydrogenase subunit E